MEEEAAAAARAAGRDPEAEKLAEAERKLKRKRRRDATHDLSDPSDSAAAAARKMLATKKQLSSKINYDALTNLFESNGCVRPSNTRLTAHERRSERHTAVFIV
jgi:transcription factor IIIB subunit 2